MAKLTDRTALGAAPATGDLLFVTDVSDTTDDAGGTDKKMTVANLLTSPTLTTPVIGAATGTSLQLSGLTASEIVITDASKNLASAAVATYPSLTELSYVKGVTSAVQTQINAKAPSTSPTFATSITGSYLTASEMLGTGASKEVVSLPVATYPSLTEVSYVKGVTSAIQTQINAKGAGTVTAVSVATANGVSGSSSGGATPALTIALGAITPSTVNGNTITTGTGTLTLGTGKTLTANNTLTLAGTDSTTMTFPTTSATIARTDAANTFTGVQTMTSPALTTPIVTTRISPASNDGATLGAVTTGEWSDLYLAEGGVINWDNGDATLTQVGNVVTLAGADLKVTTPGTASTSVATIDGTQTLTNKRVTKRTGTTTSHATPTINTDNVDFYSLTAQTEAITSFTTNLSGTPTEGQTLWIAITGTAARAITWGASFEASTVALPTTTVTTARLDVGFIWNTVTSKWRCIASA